MKKLLLILATISTFFYVYAATTVTPTFGGGTGTSTQPTFGQVLMGLSNGTYAPVATSTLGFPSLGSFSATYPIIYNSGTGVFSTGFSTSTVNSFTAQNTFTTASATTAFTSPVLYFTTASGTAMSLSGAFFVTGKSTLGNASTSVLTATDLFASGNTSLAGTLGVTGKTTLANASTSILTATDLFASGNTSLAGTLGVTGKTTLANASTSILTATDLFASGNFSVTGTTNLTGKLTMTTGSSTIFTSTGLFSSGNLSVASNATVGGTLDVTGKTTLSTASSTGAVTIPTLYNTTRAYIQGLLSDSTNATGTLGQLLQSTGTSTLWVSTSSLGITATLSGGTNGFLARWTSASALSTGLIRDNGTVAGINATSSTVTFNVQGNSNVTPFAIASSTGATLFTINVSGNVGIATTTFSTGTSAERLKVDASSTSNTAIASSCVINDFCQNTVTNSSTGINTEAGFTAQNASSTATTNYVWVGKNGTQFATTTTYSAGYKNDGTIINDGGSLQIANTGTGTNSINIITGGVSTTTNTRISINGGGQVVIATTTAPTYGFTIATTTQFLAAVIPRVVGYTSSSTITLNLDTTDIATTTVNQTTTFANPTGTAYDGMMFEYRLKATTTQTISWGTSFASSTGTYGVALPLTIASGTTRVLNEYRLDSGKYECVGVVGAFNN